MKLILVITSLITVITAQTRQSSFGRGFSGRDDSPEDRFDDSRESFFRSGNRLHDSRDNSREDRIKISRGFGSNRFDDSRENFGVGTFRSSFGRRRDSDEDSFEVRNRFRSNIGNSARRRFDDSDEISRRRGQSFRKIDDSDEIFGLNRNTFNSRNTNSRISTGRSSFNRFDNSPKRLGGTKSSFGRFNNLPPKINTGRQTFNRFDDSDENILRSRNHFGQPRRTSTIGFGSGRNTGKQKVQKARKQFGFSRNFGSFDDSPESLEVDSPEIFSSGRRTFSRIDDSGEHVFRTRTHFGQPRQTSAVRFGTGRKTQQRVDTPKKQFGFNRNLVRFDDSDETFEVDSPEIFSSGRKTFARIDDSGEHVFRTRTHFGQPKQTPAVRFGTGIKTQQRIGKPRKQFGFSRNFGSFDDSHETLEVDSPEIFSSGRRIFNRIDDSGETVFRTQTHFGQPRQTSAVRFGTGRKTQQGIDKPKKQFGFNRNLVRFDDSDETFEVGRNTFTDRSKLFTSPRSRFDDSPEDHFGRNINIFKSGVSNNFLDDDSDEDVFINVFNKPRIGTPHQTGRVHSHFSNRNTFDTRTFGRPLPQTKTFGTTRFGGATKPGSFKFSTPIGPRKTVLPPIQKTLPLPKKPTAAFNLNAQFGKPLKITRPTTTFPKTGRTSLTDGKRIPFSTVKTPGITGFKWPGENVSGYYVSMSTNNSPPTSYFVRLDNK